MRSGGDFIRAGKLWEGRIRSKPRSVHHLMTEVFHLVAAAFFRRQPAKSHFRQPAVSRLLEKQFFMAVGLLLATASAPEEGSQPDQMRLTCSPCSFSSNLIGLKRGQILHYCDELSEIHRLDDVQMKAGAQSPDAVFIASHGG